MKTKLLLFFSGFPAGRILLHVLALVCAGHVHFHAAGIAREIIHRHL